MSGGQVAVIEAARLSLLRGLALVRDIGDKHRAEAKAEGRECFWPDWTPLFADEDEEFTPGEVAIAAKEAAALGQVELHDLYASVDPTARFVARLQSRWMVRLTDDGYNAIRAHDCIESITQTKEL